jgi:hypothetical protein
MDILEIKHQNLSTLLSDFSICTSCKIVDRDDERIIVGYKCSRCGVAGRGGRSYFPMSVHNIIDLMQEFYHLKQVSNIDSEVSNTRNESNHQLAVVILLCTLGEVLLQHFLERLMFSKGLSQEIQTRLLNDNLSAKQRIQKLFPALVGAKWKVTVEMMNKRVDLDYLETTKFYEHAAEKRNLFLHRGSKWAIPKDMPEKCLRQIWPIVNLFVSLHNEFIAKKSNERAL